MTDILAAIDGALDAHESTAADATGNPWPGRVPDLDEVLEVLFGPEEGAELPVYVDDVPDDGWLVAPGTAAPYEPWAGAYRGYSPIRHYLNQWRSSTTTVPPAFRGRPVDFIVLDEAIAFDGSSDLHREALMADYRRTLALSPPDLTAFRILDCGGA